MTTDRSCKNCDCPESRHHPVSQHCPLPYGGHPDPLLWKAEDYIRDTTFEPKGEPKDGGIIPRMSSEELREYAYELRAQRDDAKSAMLAGWNKGVDDTLETQHRLGEIRDAKGAMSVRPIYFNKPGVFSATADNEVIIVDPSNGAITIELPAAERMNVHAVTVKKTSASPNHVTVACGGAIRRIEEPYGYMVFESLKGRWYIEGDPVESEPERAARLFHENYERLAPELGYKTREASAKPWSEVPDNNRKLMIATAEAVLKELNKGET